MTSPKKYNDNPMELNHEIQMLSMENCQLLKRIEASDWLVKQNKDLFEENKKLNTQVSHWKTYANDANDRLDRISMMRGKKSPAEAFYDSYVKRLTETLTAENQLLKEKLDDKEKPHRSKLLETINSNKQSIIKLNSQLELKFKENQRLRLICEGSGTNNVELVKSQTKISQLVQENMTLKTYLMQKHDVLQYVKYLFECTKDDLVKLFWKSCREDGEEFVKELMNSTDIDVPEFLLRPLVKDAEIQVEVSPLRSELPPILHKRRDELLETCDSGLGASLTDSESKDIEYQRIETENFRLKRQLRANTEMYELKLGHLQKQLEKSENDAICWKIAAQGAEEDGRLFERERDEARRKVNSLESGINSIKANFLRSPQSAPEPWIQFPYQQPTITAGGSGTVRDGPTSPQKSSTPPYPSSSVSSGNADTTNESWKSNYQYQLAIKDGSCTAKGAPQTASPPLRSSLHASSSANGSHIPIENLGKRSPELESYKCPSCHELLTERKLSNHHCVTRH